MLSRRLGRRVVELTFSQLTQQLGVSLVRERVFGYPGRIAAVKVTVGQHESVSAHFFEEDPVLIDSRIDALDVQIFCLRSRAY